MAAGADTNAFAFALAVRYAHAETVAIAVIVAGYLRVMPDEPSVALNDAPPGPRMSE